MIIPYMEIINSLILITLHVLTSLLIPQVYLKNNNFTHEVFLRVTFNIMSGH